MYDAADSADHLARVGRRLFDDPDETATVQRIAALAVEVVPGCAWSSVSVRVRRGRVTTAASSAPVAVELDRAQYDLGEGPCVASVTHDRDVLVADVGADRRWPAWSERAVALGARSVYSLRLSGHEDRVGSLNLYGAEAGAFDADSAARAVLFAAHASTAARAARMVTGLRRAMEGRHLIGVAQGVLMQRYGLGLDAAFEVLRRYSSHSNAKLRDVASLVVEQGALPEPHVVETVEQQRRRTNPDEPDDIRDDPRGTGASG